METGNETGGVESGNETGGVETGNETGRVETGNETGRVETGNETGRVETGNEHKVAPTLCSRFCSPTFDPFPPTTASSMRTLLVALRRPRISVSRWAILLLAWTSSAC